MRERVRFVDFVVQSGLDALLTPKVHLGVFTHGAHKLEDAVPRERVHLRLRELENRPLEGVMVWQQDL